MIDSVDVCTGLSDDIFRRPAYVFEKLPPVNFLQRTSSDLSAIRPRDALTRTRLPEGFTLVEMLVSVGIVVFLAALVFPALSKTRNSAAAIKCTSNQRILFSALMAYAQENDMTFPVSTSGTNRWFYRVSNYVPGFENDSVVDPSGVGLKPAFAKIVICPIPEHKGLKNTTGTYGLHEGFGTYDSGLPSNYTPVRLATITRPSKLPVLCCEGTYEEKNGGHKMTTTGPHPAAQIKYGYTGTTRNFGPSPNHGRQCNFTFLDGHIELRDVTKASQWPWNDPDVFKFE